MDKLISIVVPCYNVENYFDRCINSLLKQSLGIDKLELILVDDCSSDKTWEKILYYENIYPDSIIAVHLDENGRQGKARNVGIQYVSAPYVGFVDSDDWIEPDMYETLLEIICEKSCDIVMCRNWRDFDDKKQILQPKETGEKDQLIVVDTEEKRKYFYATCPIGFGVWDKLYKTDFLISNDIIFPENLAYEDHYFSSLLYIYTSKVYILEKRLYHYYVNRNSTVLSTNSKHHYDILSVNMLLIDELRERGFWDTYAEEIKYQFLCLCYLASIKMGLLRMTSFPYDYFCKLKQIVNLVVGDYSANKYVNLLVTETNKILLELLDKNLEEPEFELFCNEVKEHIKKGYIII